MKDINDQKCVLANGKVQTEKVFRDGGSNTNTVMLCIQKRSLTTSHIKHLLQHHRDVLLSLRSNHFKVTVIPYFSNLFKLT